MYSISFCRGYHMHYGLFYGNELLIIYPAEILFINLNAFSIFILK